MDCEVDDRTPFESRGFKLHSPEHVAPLRVN